MPYYLCDNFGKCNLADAGEPIELPPGAEPICPAPACRERLSPAGDSNRDPVYLASLGSLEREERRLFYPIGLVILLIAGLVGGIAYLVYSPTGPEALSLEVAPQVIASVGNSVEVPVTVKPATAGEVTLTVGGKLPPGMVLDGPGRRLEGTVQSPGSFPVIFRASSPRFSSASVMTIVVVKEKPGVPPSLTLWAAPHVLGRVGEPLEVPMGIGPAGMEGATLGVQGDLPAGVKLDPSGKRLYGTPESAGSSDVVLTARAPGYAGASAPMNFIILEAKPTPAPAALTPNRPAQVPWVPSPAVRAEATPSPAVRTEVMPAPAKPSPTPASVVVDNAAEDVLAAPAFGNQATPALRNALRNCDRVALSFQFGRREFDALDRSSMQNLNRLAAFLRRPGMAKRHLVVVGCTDGTGTRSENNFFARSRAESFAAYLQEAGVKNPIDELLGSSGDYLVPGRDSSTREPQSNRRVDLYLKR